MDEENRVKFYSKYDMACGYELRKSDEIFSKILNSNYSCNSINDAIELHNIKKYIDNDLRLPEWDEKTYAQRIKIVQGFPSIIGSCMKSISCVELTDYFHQIHWQYQDDFWEVFATYKVYQNIDGHSFELFLNSIKPGIISILKQKDVVNCYDQELRKYLLSNPLNAEIMVRKYLSNESVDFFIPKSITSNDKSILVEEYIKCPEANLNYIMLIATSMSNSNNSALPLSDASRLKAKQRARKFWEDHFSENKGIKIGAQVSFESGLKEDVLLDISNPLEVKITYNKDWIYDNLDYPTLLNNFIYLFTYVDSSCHSLFPSFYNQLSVIEKISGVKGKKEYLTGVAFSQKEMLSTLQMRGYRNVLKEKGISIEDMIAWFFNSYLNTEFSFSGIPFYPPTKGTSYAEKNKLLASSIDGVLKRFKIYVNNGEVDEELFLMSSSPESFSSIPSLIESKYAYCNSENLKAELNLLFSDQSMLAYPPKSDSKYSSAADLFLKERITLEDYNGNPQITENIDWLKERGAISVTDGRIVLCKSRYLLLSDLWNDEAICIHKRKEIQSEIDNMIASGDLLVESTLFSKSEQGYLNYVLNHSEYSNGLDLRNRYIHDSIVRKDGINETHYDIFLKIWILIIIKMNEELCYINS